MQNLDYNNYQNQFQKSESDGNDRNKFSTLSNKDFQSLSKEKQLIKPKELLMP